MAMKPITRYGKFTPSGLDRSGEIRMRALAGLGDTLGGITDTMVRKELTERAEKEREEKAQEQRKTREEARIEGMTEGAEIAEKGVAPELRMSGNIGDSQYNTTVMKAYINGTYPRVDKIFADAEAQFPNDTANFDKIVSEGLKGIREALPEWATLDVDAYANRSQKTYFNRVQKEEQRIVDAQVKGNLLDGFNSSVDQASNLAFTGETDSLQEALEKVNSDLDSAVGLLTPKEISSRRKQLEDSVAIATQKGQFQRLLDSDQKPEDIIKIANGVLAELRTTPLSELDAQQNETLRKQLETQVNQYVTEYNKTVEMSDAEIRKANGIANVSARFTDEPAVTSDVITDTDIDNHYNEQRTQFSENIEMRMDERIDYVNQVRAMPKTMKTEILTDLRSNEPDAVIVAAQTITELNALQGMPDAFSGQDLVYADAIQRNMEFYDFDEALQRAKDIAFPPNSTRQALVEARKAELSVDKTERYEGYAKIIDDAFETGVFGFGTQFTPSDINRDEMIADLKTLTEDNYLLGFEADRASEYAVKKMQNSYKVGEFGFLRHAPEDFYGLGKTKDASWIRESLHKELVAKYGDGFAPEDIILISDTETATMAKKRTPTYAVMIRMPDGSLQPVDERANPSIDYPAVQNEYVKGLEEQAQRPILNRRRFLEEYKMPPEQAAKARKLLSNNNVFRLIGQGVGNIDEVPEFIAKFFEGAQNELRQSREMKQEQSRQLQEAMYNWNEEYIARLQKASGKEEVEITIADLSNQ